ncbi:MAG: methionyl-tRNA formyltransferase [Mycoplasmatales bacterium]|nr:methionyl-tRNA formyltransferase [Mycoplasmatales bacterium]
MKIVLAGSPKISVKTFETIINNFDVVAIVTQPDRKKGRGMKMIETPVSLLASKYKIKTFKPEKISFIKEDLKKLNFDLFISFAFGQWVPESVLSLGKFKPINIHGSLLPKYRGASPIQYAILNGDRKIGITIIEMIKKMDAGNMLFKASKEISKETTTGEAFEIISNLANENIVEWINQIKIGNVLPTAQSNDFTLAPKIKKSFGEIKKDDYIEATLRKIKALNPFPGAFTFIDEKRLKIFNATTKKTKNAIPLNLKDGIIFINDYQYESKKRIKI